MKIINLKPAFFIFLLVCVIIPRLCFYYLENHKSPRMLWADEAGYKRIAINIISNQAFSLSATPPFKPTGYRGPVYPLFIAGVFLLFNSPNIIFIYIIQTLIVVLLFFLVRSLYQCISDEHPKYLDWLLCLLCCAYPAFIVYPLRILPDFMFTVFVTLYILLQHHSFKKNSILLHFISGIILGLTGLCKPAALLLPIFITPVLIWNLKKKCALPLFCFFLGIISILTPWIARNKIVLNTYMPVLQGGRNLYASSMNRLSKIPIKMGKHMPLYGGTFLERESKGKTEAEADTEFLKKGFALILKHPFVYLKFCVIKGFNLWKVPIGYTLIKQRSQMLAGLFLFAHICFLTVAMYGIFLLVLKRTPASALPAVIIIYFTVFHSLTHSLPRYHLPCLPFLFIGAAFAIQRLTLKYFN